MLVSVTSLGPEAVTLITWSQTFTSNKAFRKIRVLAHKYLLSPKQTGLAR
jgi:hypothetical protein